MVRDDAVVDVRIALGACFGLFAHLHTRTHVGDNAFTERASVRAGYANSLTLIHRENPRKNC